MKKMKLKVINYTILTVLTVDLLATSGDITMTWTSPIFAKLNSTDPDVNPLGECTTPYQNSWIGALINVGAMIGPFPYSIIAEKFGRKIGLLSIAIPHIMSYLTLAFSQTVYLYYFARVLGGIAVGGGYTLLPMYVAEVAEDSNRGMLTTTLSIFWAFGNFLPYIIGPYTSAMWFNIILACFPTTFFICFFLIAPESPYYLIAKNKIPAAKQSLSKLRSNDATAVKTEIKKIQIELTKNEDKISLWQFFGTKVYMKGLLISVVLLVAQQLSGINAVLFNTQEIFDAAGANGLAPEVSSIIIGFVIFSSSFFTPFVADRWGRKILMIVSLLGITLAHLAFGIYFFLQNRLETDVSSISWLPIVSLIVFIITFNIGIGPIPWTISSEFFPTSVKSYSSSIVAFSLWTTSFFVTFFFTDLVDNFGQGETFWLFGGFCFLALLFTYFMIPETRGKSFQEIQEILEQRWLFISL